MGGTWQNFACQPSEFPVLLLPACFLAMVAGMKARYDVVILGAGHNGMVAAAYGATPPPKAGTTSLALRPA